MVFLVLEGKNVEKATSMSIIHNNPTQKFAPEIKSLFCLDGCYNLILEKLGYVYKTPNYIGCPNKVHDKNNWIPTSYFGTGLQINHIELLILITQVFASAYAHLD